MEKYIINKKDSNGNPISDSVPDIFMDQFDVTWMASGMAQGHSYKSSFTILPTEGNQTKDDGRVIYNFNHDGFRCDDFTKVHNGVHVLFSGCSNTEGVGSPLETIWSKTLYNKLSEENDLSGFFSLGKAGQGWQKIIANFIIYGEKYGFPDFFFVLLPNLGRFWDWHPKDNRWYYVQRYPVESVILPNKPAEPTEDFFAHRSISLEEHRKIFIDFCAGWKLFEKFCESKNVKMLWASYDYTENYNHDLFSISQNYINLSSEALAEFTFNARPHGNFKIDELHRRDGHSGTIEHDYWKSNFIEKLKASPQTKLKIGK